MFAVHCPRHGCRVLLALDAIEGMTRHAGSIAITYRCTCGHRGRWHSRLDRHPQATLS